MIGFTIPYNALIVSANDVRSPLHRVPSSSVIVSQNPVFLPIQLYCVLRAVDDTADNVVEIIILCGDLFQVVKVFDD